MDTSPLILRDKEILGGIPVFAGTRVPLKTLFDYLKSNHPLADFLDDFPTVPVQQAQAVLDQVSRNITDGDENSEVSDNARSAG